MKLNLPQAQSDLLAWYERHKRPFPWRANRDPYRIWISETMLQQTTSTAVIPFFERFLERFPTLQSLAEAALPHVLEAWAGLGYYSRARNLHKAAIALNAAPTFPRTHEELLKYPGLGPYTARAVASLAFDAPVGVVDGNVIRVLARVYAADWDWWKPAGRALVQTRVDLWVAGVSSYEMNQALMELGRTVCTPKSPACFICPIQSNCAARTKGLVAQIPKPKPRRKREIWEWTAEVVEKQGRIRLVRNSETPFLRDQWSLPGRARKLEGKPTIFDFKHTITHHDIYVTVRRKAAVPAGKWVKRQEVRQHAPASLIQKAMARAEEDPAAR